MKNYLVTGGAGFIACNFVEDLVSEGHRVVVLDALTYAGHMENLLPVEGKIEFIHGDICDTSLVPLLFEKHRFDVVVNFAAESHVDRSIENAEAFIRTNVLGVGNLLQSALRFWETQSDEYKSSFRFVQVSTDEVFGTLGDEGYFTEQTPYAPNSPYSASKAGGDHLARAWYHTYRLPVITTNCSNNYGPFQYPEKLIPYMIQCALSGKDLPVYGNGKNVRDWIHVKDHCHGIRLAIEKGDLGESYCFGGRSERQNLHVVELICKVLDEVQPRLDGRSYSEQIRFVEDRKGHDWRYAIDDSKAEKTLGFTRQYARFEDGLKDTVLWYLNNRDWVKKVLNDKPC